MKVAVAVFHYERNDLTDAVLQQLTSVEHVFVHDDGSLSTYQVPKYLKNSHRILIAIVRVRGGYIKAVNRMMRFLSDSGYEAVWTLNNDITIVGPALSVLESLTAVLEAHPTVAAVTPGVDPNPHPDMRPNPNIDFTYLPFIDWVCPLVRIRAWNEVGGFDQNLKGYGCDIQFCYDARNIGWKFGIVPNQKVYHQMGATCKTFDSMGHDDLDFMTEYLKKKYNVSDVWTLTR